MSKALVLTEKPSVARDIARVLGCHQKGNGYLEGKAFVITWALGHLVTHADPESYGDQYKQWKLDDLPMLFPKLKLAVIKQTGKQFQAVQAQMNRKDVTEIIIATDAGREGELVARWIIEKAQVRKTIKRLWISSVTDQAIRKGFQHLKKGTQYEPLFRSAVARAEADWYVGLNATRALTCKYNAQLSCGRVQTPTLAIIAQREEQIHNFNPRPYYGLKVETNRNLTLTWLNQQINDSRTFLKKEADMLLQHIHPQQLVRIDAVTKKTKRIDAPELYNLTQLQRDAHQKFGFSAKETLSIMQKLYEYYKLLTYPRTDSKHLSTDIVPTLKERLTACTTGPYATWTTLILRKPLAIKSFFVDDSKVSDHHAIIPTEQRVSLSQLTDKERKIYDLVVRRFLAVFLPACEYEQTTIQASVGHEQLVAKGRIIKNQGWQALYSSEMNMSAAHPVVNARDAAEEDEQTLPAVSVGEKLRITSVRQTSGETKPPARFNEGTLLAAMENPAQYMPEESASIKQTLGEAGGLGTVATRADIIEKLFSTFLIEKVGNSIKLTSKGKQLLDLVPEDLKSPALTARWEQKLDLIARGKLEDHIFVEEMKEYTRSLVTNIKQSKKTFRHDNLSGKVCPDCGKVLLEVSGKNGKMLVCQDRSCGHRKTVSKLTNARCPNCRKKLELRGEGPGQVFGCRCGYKEKRTSFLKRKSHEQNKATKHDVAKYLTKQKQEKALVNPALAEALAKLKKDL